MKRNPGKLEREFQTVVKSFSENPRVAVGQGKGFGSGTLKVEGKIFAMLSSKSEFVVKLSKPRVHALASSGVGRNFEPRPGKQMKEWLVVKAENADWVALAREACEFVSLGKNKHYQARVR